MTAPRTVVVVGTGVAGTTAAATLRVEGYDGRVVLVGGEPHAPYRRPALSKEVLRGDKTAEQVRIKPEQWFADNTVELVTGTTVTDVDAGAGTIALSDGSRLAYDALLLATGGRPRTLPATAGLGPEDGVHVLRSAHDVTALQTALAPGASLLVVGAGFLGAEVAASARTMGCDVTVLEAAPAPLGRVLPTALAGFYTALHRDRGVDLRTGVGLASVERAGERLRVTGTDGTSFGVDAVLVAVGMTPATELARAAGATIGDGIVVDGSGATSVPGIWAAGDAAAFPDRVTGAPRRLEHWQSAMTQGTTVGRSIAGTTSAWTEVPWCWSDQYGVNLQVCGNPSASDEMALRGKIASGCFTAVFARGGALTGAVTVDRSADMRALRKLLVSARATPLEVVADEGTDLAALATPQPVVSAR